MEGGTGMDNNLLAIRRFLADDSGVTIIEYALIAALIGLGVSATVLLVRDAINDTFNAIIKCLKTPSACLT